MNDIFHITGFKGGVGKSLVSMSLVDALRQDNIDCLLIDADTSNADVYKCYHNTITCKDIDLDIAEGWIDLVNLCDDDENKNHSIVINGAARNNTGVINYSNILVSALPELKRNLITFFVINTERDSVELLLDYCEALPGQIIHVVRNTFFGDERYFEDYNKSNIRKDIEKSGGLSLNFDKLAKRVSSELYSGRKPIETASVGMPLGNRAELIRWRSLCKSMFDEVLTR